MPFVAGFGDEVILALGTFTVVVIITLIWKSTRVRQDRIFGVAPVSREFPNPSSRTAESYNSNSTSPIVLEQSTSSSFSYNLPEASSEFVGEQEEQYDDSECATIKVRFIDETQFEARSPLRISLERFRERHVRPAVLSQLRVNQQIKLIFKGRVLDPQKTLAELGLKDGCTVHALLMNLPTPQRQTSQTRSNPSDGEVVLAELDLSHMFFPAVGTVLFIIWWCQVAYSHYFSLTSSMSLVSLTVLYVASVMNAYLNY